MLYIQSATLTLDFFKTGKGLDSVRILLILLLSFASLEGLDFRNSGNAWVAFVDDGQQLVKQVNHPDLSKQVRAVAEVVAAHIAKEANLPINRVEILPPYHPYAGEAMVGCPATLHTVVPGQSLKTDPCFRQYRLQQNRQTSLLRELANRMAAHPDLPIIVAFDTFVGNPDRRPANLFYDSASNHYYGIDLGHSFTENLCRRALKECQVASGPLPQTIVSSYLETLERLVALFPPERTKALFYLYAKEGGFRPGSPLLTDKAQASLDLYLVVVDASYRDAQQLIHTLKQHKKRSAAQGRHSLVSLRNE